MTNCLKYFDIAEFEKVSIGEYIRARSKFDGYDDQANETLIEMYTQEWNNIRLPARATEGSAGYDFFLPYDIEISEHPIAFPTGICCDINPGWVLMLYPRSGLGFKYGMRLSNSTGVIDSDFYHNPDNEGHIAAKFYAADKPVELKAGDRFMQGIFLPFGTVVGDHAGGSRTGGVGSTGLR